MTIDDEVDNSEEKNPWTSYVTSVVIGSSVGCLAGVVYGEYAFVGTPVMVPGGIMVAALEHDKNYARNAGMATTAYMAAVAGVYALRTWFGG